MRKVYRVRLKHLNVEGLTAYAIAKEVGITQTTVMKYIRDDEVILDTLPISVVNLAAFFGRDWRDSDIVQVIEVEEPDPEMETAHAA